MQLRMYFGHPVNAYDTELEQRLVRKIAEAFPMWEIENPNQPKHQERYDQYKIATGNGMTYFTEEVLPSCRGGIFLPFRDGKWGAGVFKEAQYYSDRNFPIWSINAEGFVGQLVLANIHPLSIEETRARIRTSDGKIIPYD